MRVAEKKEIDCPLKREIKELLKDLHTTLEISKIRLALQILGISKATYSRWLNMTENYPMKSMRNRTIRLLQGIKSYIKQTSADEFMALANRVNPNWRTDDDDRADILHAKILSTHIPDISIHENEHEKALPIAGLLENMTISQIITAVIEEKDVDADDVAMTFDSLFDDTLKAEIYQKDKWQETKNECLKKVRSHYKKIDTVEDKKRNIKIREMGKKLEELLNVHIATKEKKINKYNTLQLSIAELDLEPHKS